MRIAAGPSGNPDPWDDPVIARTYARHVLGAIAERLAARGARIREAILAGKLPDDLAALSIEQLSFPLWDGVAITGEPR